MPVLHQCLNYEVCGNYVAVGEKSLLCARCCEIARQNDRDMLTEQEYKRLNAKHPNRPTFREIERGVK